MKKYGYGRVSSPGQRIYGMSLQDQKAQLLAQGVAEEDIYLESYTGHKMDRPAFDKVLSMLQPGDELVVCKLDRFARTAPEGALLVRQLVEKGVRANILNMGVADNTPMGKVMVTVMLAFAEFERDMIVERTSSGKAQRRERDPEWREGRRRKEVTNFRDVRERQIHGELTVDAACSELGISRRTYFRRAKEASA